MKLATWKNHFSGSGFPAKGLRAMCSRQSGLATHPATLRAGGRICVNCQDFAMSVCAARSEMHVTAAHASVPMRQRNHCSADLQRSYALGVPALHGGPG